MNKKLSNLLLGLLVVTLGFFACRQENFLDDVGAKLSFSTDTVTFDTVFTTFGSTTKNFRVYNPHAQPVSVSSIYLAGGDASRFRLNIDGSPTNKAENVEIPAKDSLYVFVEVTLDPNDDSAPLLISDSVVFITNGNVQNIKLVAWGQDVHFYNGDLIEENVWTADKPHVIHNFAFVDTNEVLTINAGTKIHLHADAFLFIAGHLKIEGTQEEPVIFSSDRLEEFYDDVPGQWNRILFFNGSSGDINHAVIKNGIIGLQAGLPDEGTPPTVKINNSVIHNMSAYGLYSVTSSMDVYNSQISNAQYALLNVDAGGDYNFYHCTFAHYNSSRNLPGIVLLNKLALGVFDETGNLVDTAYFQDDLNAYFGNCIVYGSKPSELFFESSDENELNFQFDHSLLKLEVDSFETGNPDYFRNNIYNENPEFVNIKDDFQLDTLSPAKDAANLEILNQFPDILGTDLNGNSRTEDEKPDLGAYERMEGQKEEE